MGTRRIAWELWVVAIATTVGLIDAAASKQADLATIFAVSTFLALVAIARQGFSAPVRLRGDLARWLQRRAASEGTTPDELATALLSSARAGLDGTGPVSDEAVPQPQ